MPDIEAHRGFPTAETFVWQPDTLPPSNNLLLQPKKNLQSFFLAKRTFSLFAQQPSRRSRLHFPISSHHILSPTPIYPKIAPTNSHPFQLTLKLVLLTGKCMGGRVFPLQDLERRAHFRVNSGANVLSLVCWLSPIFVALLAAESLGSHQCRDQATPGKTKVENCFLRDLKV